MRWLLISLVITVIGSLVLSRLVGGRAFFAFLFLPFLPFLLKGRGGDTEDRAVRRCPRCDHTSADPDDLYCPRDGTRMS